TTTTVEPGVPAARRAAPATGGARPVRRPAGPHPMTETVHHTRVTVDDLASSVAAVAAPRGHRSEAGVFLEAAVAAQGVPDPGDDVGHRVVDVLIARQLVGLESRVDRLHQPLRGGATLGVDVPQVDGPRVTARLLLDHGPDARDVFLGHRNPVV